jgi:hypothetical protein
MGFGHAAAHETEMEVYVDSASAIVRARLQTMFTCFVCFNIKTTPFDICMNLLYNLV